MLVVFSILIPVHNTEKEQFLRAAFGSLVANTHQPDEIVVVLDGTPTADIQAVLDAFRAVLPIKTITLEESVGIGPALAIGLEECRNEWIARCDSDDICAPDRFEKQLQFIRDNPEIDAFSTPLVEFADAPDEESTRLRKLPLTHDEIVNYARWRNPLNHPSVMMRRSKALQAGNYQDEPSFEDYSLWIRMLQNGARLGNMKHPLVFARAGKALQLRRGGVAYAVRELSMLRKMRSSGFISQKDFCISVALKTPIRLLPASLRHRFYGAALRT
jgi:glycosyltransferase involved in cell wall biosynthesis